MTVAVAAPFGAGAASLLLAAGLAVYATLGLDRSEVNFGEVAGTAAVLLLLLSVSGAWAGGAVLAQALLGVLYIGVLVARGQDVDTGAPAFAAGLLLTGELAVLARDLRAGALGAPGSAPRRLLVLALLGLAAVLLGWVLVAASAAALPAGPGMTLAGTVAAAAAVSLLVWAARRSGD